jgi:hypothetical protein
MSILICTLLAALLAAFFFSLKRPGAGRGSLHTPPGPKGWPVIGNLFDMPRTYEWETYREWSRRYSTQYWITYNVLAVDAGL